MLLKIDKTIIFAGYRDWANTIFHQLEPLFDTVQFFHVRSPEELTEKLSTTQIDAILLVGWSWVLPAQQVEENVVLGLHPSDMPAYAGGSPLQHQIIDGVIHSKLSLFHVTPQLDRGLVLLKEPLSLEGHMDEIFSRMIEVGTYLLVQAVNTLERIKTQVKQQLLKPMQHDELKKRLQPDMSCLAKQALNQLTNLQLYNLIRAREAPYPNVYLEDETGKLYFRRVDFEPKN